MSSSSRKSSTSQRPSSETAVSCRVKTVTCSLAGSLISRTVKLDGLVRGLGAAIAQRKTGWAAAVLTTIGLLYAYTGVSLVQDLTARDAGRVVVGAKTFTEQYILTEILAGHIAESCDD